MTLPLLNAIRSPFDGGKKKGEREKERERENAGQSTKLPRLSLSRWNDGGAFPRFSVKKKLAKTEPGKRWGFDLLRWSSYRRHQVRSRYEVAPSHREAKFFSLKALR